MLPLSSLCFFSALKYLPLAEATAINYGTPILVIILAVVFLGERMTRAADRARAGGHRRDVPDRAAGLRRVPERGALLALGSAVVLRRVPDPDAHARRRGFARAAVLPGARRHGNDDRAPAVARHRLRDAMVGRRAHRPSRACSARSATSCSFSRSSRRPASALSPFTYMQLVLATLIGWVAVRQFPGRVDASPAWR